MKDVSAGAASSSRAPTETPSSSSRRCRSGDGRLCEPPCCESVASPTTFPHCARIPPRKPSPRPPPTRSPSCERSTAKIRYLPTRDEFPSSPSAKRPPTPPETSDSKTSAPPREASNRSDDSPEKPPIRPRTNRLSVGTRRLRGDLAAELRKDGFKVDRVALYDAVPVGRLPEETVRAVRDGDVFAAAIFSPRSAALWSREVRRAGLAERVRTVEHWLLAESARKELDPMPDVIRVARAPSTDAMLKLVPSPA